MSYRTVTFDTKAKSRHIKTVQSWTNDSFFNWFVGLGITAGIVGTALLIVALVFNVIWPFIAIGALAAPFAGQLGYTGYAIARKGVANIYWDTNQKGSEFYSILNTVQNSIDAVREILWNTDKEDFAYRHVQSALSAVTDIQNDCLKFTKVAIPFVRAGADMTEQAEKLRKHAAKAEQVKDITLNLVVNSLSLGPSSDHIEIIARELQFACEGIDTGHKAVAALEAKTA